MPDLGSSAVTVRVEARVKVGIRVRVRLRVKAVVRVRMEKVRFSCESTEGGGYEVWFTWRECFAYINNSLSLYKEMFKWDFRKNFCMERVVKN